MTPKTFVNSLAKVRLPTVFNPYSDRCAVYDRADAARRRKRNLEAFIEAALDHRVDTIWVARDLGYRGGRRTGVPLTDEVHLDQIGRLLGGIALERATLGPAVSERTAAIIWKVLARIEQPVVLWNVFPFHPHDPDDPFSNRSHTLAERDATLTFLLALIKMVRPKQLIAIGRDAQHALDKLDIHVVGVRHPSYGGQSGFIAALFDLYGVR